MKLYYSRFMIAAAVVVSSAAQAQPPAAQTSDNEIKRALAPAQLNAIRAMGRNVLAAKKSSTEDGADAAQLARLRTSLDQLIAADLDPNNRSPITVQGQESAEQIQSRAAIADLRAAARAEARAMAGQMRRHGASMALRAQASPQVDTTSAGFPMGRQRAELFERWAQKLDAAMADDSPDRVAQMLELSAQLQAASTPRSGKGGGMSDVPQAGTPTLQAMPAGFVPPKKNADSAANK